MNEEFEEKTLKQLIIDLKDVNNYKSFKHGSFIYDLGYYQGNLLVNEIERLNNIINELKEYEYAVYKIKKYINSYNPYFIDTQEDNNKKIANIINEIGKKKLKDSD